MNFDYITYQKRDVHASFVNTRLKVKKTCPKNKWNVKWKAEEFSLSTEGLNSREFKSVMDGKMTIFWLN